MQDFNLGWDWKEVPNTLPSAHIKPEEYQCRKGHRLSKPPERMNKLYQKKA